MFLRYGVNENNALVGIEDVSRGKTHLRCPYCEDKLTAKKGKIKEHHFAHQGQTCLTVTRGKIPSLPLYDNFHIQLSVKELDELKVFWNNYGARNYDICVKPSWRLVSSKLLAFNQERGGFYEFTALGKIPVGALSLRLFNEVQEPLLCEKLSQLEQKAERAQVASLSSLPERLADLQIYRALFKRVLTNTRKTQLPPSGEFKRLSGWVILISSKLITFYPCLSTGFEPITFWRSLLSLKEAPLRRLLSLWAICKLSLVSSPPSASGFL